MCASLPNGSESIQGQCSGSAPFCRSKRRRRRAVAIVGRAILTTALAVCSILRSRQFRGPPRKVCGCTYGEHPTGVGMACLSGGAIWTGAPLARTVR